MIMTTTVPSTPPAAGGDKPVHPFVRAGAKAISVIFHPLFIPVYVSWFLIYIYPIFPAFTGRDKGILLLRFLVMYTLFPLATVLLAKGLGFIQSIYLNTQKDRIIPYVACGVYYFWMWYVLRNQLFPDELETFTLAIFLASSGGLLANSYFKVSMHAIGLGVMAAFMVVLAFLAVVPFGFYLAVAILITGVVCSARLATGDHYPLEIYVGLFIGILAQLISYWVVF